MSHRTFALQIGEAFRIKSEPERSGALRRLVAAVANAAAGNGEEDNDRLVSRYGMIYRGLRDRLAQRGLGEVDLALFATTAQRAQSACCFALIFDLPMEIAENALAEEDAGFLLLACRSRNFAWSTVSALLALSHSPVEDRALAMRRCEDYHALSSADAQRFMRLLKVNLQNRAPPSAQAGAALRTNVR